MGFRAFGLLFLAIICGWNAYKAISSGRFEDFGFNFTRDENPVRFLAGVVGWCFLCAFFSYRLVELFPEVTREP